MMTNTPAAAQCLVGLSGLSDDALLASTRGLVGRSNQLLAALLAHLGEVEARGIHRVRGCASLYTYCVYELRMSEDAAFRRARAARIARQFPIALEKIAAGEIHLTGLLMLGSHLTDENHLQVLARAKHRTKKEIAALVRMLDPLPDVPAVVEPLGLARPELAVPANATWSQMTAALCGPIRELEPGDRPNDWVDTEVEVLAEAATVSLPEQPPSGGISDAAGPQAYSSLAPQRYKVQFTASEEYVHLLEQARDLLAHAVPSRSIEEVHLRAMRALVAELKQHKYAVTDRPRSKRSQNVGRKAGSGRKEEAAVPSVHSDVNDGPRAGAVKRTVAENSLEGTDPRAAAGHSDRPEPRWRGRYIPAPVRRAVWQRDGGRCTYVDAGGQRCRETRYIELHHDQPHARGGRPTESNIHLRCRAHNALAAEEDFGRELMACKKGRTPRSSEGLLG